MKERSSRRFGILGACLLLMGKSGLAAAQESTLVERDVSFHNGAVELRGTFLAPDAAPGHPTVVFLHGSGSSTREGARPYAEDFTQLGIASLMFDKRGCGSSGGSWTTSSLDDLAGDALAALDCAQKQPEVDAKRVGFWGVSQAGWVATLAASWSPDVAFLVIVSGGGSPPRESELFSYEQAFEKAGFSEDEKADARDVLNTYFDYLATGEGRAELVDLLEVLRRGPLEPLAKALGKIVPSDENRQNWSWVATWDPAPCIAQIHCPILLMFGERDREHPTELAVEEWRAGLNEAGNDQVTLMVFPGAGHGIRMREGWTDHMRAPFADGYMDAMVGWMWRHVAKHSR